MTESALTVVALLIGLVAGASLAAYFLRSRTTVDSDQSKAEVERLQSELIAAREQRAGFEERAKAVDELRDELGQREIKFETLMAEIASLREERSRLETRMEEERKAFEEQKALLGEAQAKLSDAFNALSSDALRKNNQAFLELAKEALEGYSKEAKGELEKRKEAIDSLVSPLKDSLEKVDQHIKDLEEKRSDAYGRLSEQVKALTDTQTRLQSETSNLVRALRTPNQRGRWGEIQLKRVVEMAGMLDWCDFHEQQTTTTEGKILRPDLTVQLPNRKTIVVDSKTPLDAYLTAIEATEDGVKVDALKQHAKQVRKHIDELCEKRYWDQFSSTPDFVVMFIPGEPVFGAALEQDPSLIEHGAKNNVLIATPVTLIALLRAIHYGWRQERLEENAQKISELGRDLYARIAYLAEHFSKVGKNLDRAVGSYNEAVGSLESRVLPQTRKFKELQAATAEDIEVVAPIERSARRINHPELIPSGSKTIEAADLFAVN